MDTHRVRSITHSKAAVISIYCAWLCQFTSRSFYENGLYPIERSHPGKTPPLCLQYLRNIAINLPHPALIQTCYNYLWAGEMQMPAQPSGSNASRRYGGLLDMTTEKSLCS